MLYSDYENDILERIENLGGIVRADAKTIQKVWNIFYKRKKIASIQMVHPADYKSNETNKIYVQILLPYNEIKRSFPDFKMIKSFISSEEISKYFSFILSVAKKIY